MIWVGYVDRLATRRCSNELEGLLGGSVSVLLDDLEVPDGFPVVFNDGMPLDEINDFLRNAPVALSSVRKYAADLAGLARWAQSLGKTLFTLTSEDLLRYRRALTDPPPGSGRRPVSPGRWNDLVAVFSTFFRWNVHLGKIDRSPIPRWPDGKGRERLKLRTVAEQRIRFLTADEIRVFRSAGFEDDRGSPAPRSTGPSTSGRR